MVTEMGSIFFPNPIPETTATKKYYTDRNNSFLPVLHASMLPYRINDNNAKNKCACNLDI